MPKVTILPLNETIEISEEISLKDGLKANGIFVKSICGGVASCGQCIVKIIDGEEFLTPIQFKEIKLLGNVYHITKERLSCQIKISGDITISIDSGKSDSSSESKKPEDKKRILVKTKAQKEAELEERQKKREKRATDRKDEEEQPHWKIKRDPMRPKRLGGNRRPKLFNLKSEDYNSSDEKKIDSKDTKSESDKNEN